MVAIVSRYDAITLLVAKPIRNFPLLSKSGSIPLRLTK
jgi:hypothetical protein